MKTSRVRIAPKSAPASVRHSSNKRSASAGRMPHSTTSVSSDTSAPPVASVPSVVPAPAVTSAPSDTSASAGGPKRQSKKQKKTHVPRQPAAGEDVAINAVMADSPSRVHVSRGSVPSALSNEAPRRQQPLNLATSTRAQLNPN